MVKFGFNWDTGSVSFEQAIPAMQAAKANAHLLMLDPGGFFLRAGDLDTIRKVASAVPDCTLIIRIYSRNEGRWTDYPSASQYEQHWRWIRQQLDGALTKRLVFDDPVNEPNLAGSDRLAARVYVSRCIELVKAANNAGIKLAIGAWSVGTPHESLFEAEYLPLWKLLAQSKQAISMHLYGAIPFEAGELAPLDIVLDAKLARSAMRGKWSVSYAGWFIGRAYRIIQIFAKYGLGTPEIYVTECIVDNVFNSSNSQIKEAWRAKYGIDMYQRDPRGIFCWERYLAEMFPEYQFDEAIAYLLSYARKNIFYHEAFKGACLFALNAQWGYPNGSNRQAGSNYADGKLSRFRSELLPKVNVERIDMPVTYKARISSKTTSNVRGSADTSAPIVLILTNAWILADVTEVNISNDGYEWLQVKTDTVTGFVAKTSNLVIEPIVTEPTEPVYEVNLYDLTVRGSEDEMKDYARVFEMLRDKFANPNRVE